MTEEPGRELIRALDEGFDSLERMWFEFLEKIPEEGLYERTGGATPSAASSPGERLLRSAAAVEQVFGGLTASLWDDPFEWTLPEELDRKSSIRAYLDEVAAIRKRGLGSIRTDEDLGRCILTPKGERSIASVLVSSISRAHGELAAAENARS